MIRIALTSLIVLMCSATGYCQYRSSDSLYIDGLSRYIKSTGMTIGDTLLMFNRTIGYFSFPDTLNGVVLSNVGKAQRQKSVKSRKPFTAVEIRPISLKRDTAIFSIVEGSYSYRLKRPLFHMPLWIGRGYWHAQAFYYYIFDRNSRLWKFYSQDWQQ
jgi:hypothetical protein